MCELAAAALGPRARVSDVERALGGRSLTLRTVRRLTELHPEHAFSLVIGSDLLARGRRAGTAATSWRARSRSSSSAGRRPRSNAGRRRSGAGDRHARRQLDRGARRARGGHSPPTGSCRARFSTTYCEKGYTRSSHELHVRSRGERPRSLAEGPAEPTPSVFIMGAGVVGTALAARLVRAERSRSSACTAARSSCRTRRARSPASSRRPATSPTSSASRTSSSSPCATSACRRSPSGWRSERRASARIRSCCTRRARTRRAPSWRPRCRTCARSGRCTRWCRCADPRVAVEALKEVAFGIEGDEPARAIGEADRARAGRAGGVPRGREPGPLPRGRGDGVELRRRAGRHGADAAGARGRAARSGAAGADSAARPASSTTSRSSGCRAR